MYKLINQMKHNPQIATKTINHRSFDNFSGEKYWDGPEPKSRPFATNTNTGASEGQKKL